MDKLLSAYPISLCVTYLVTRLASAGLASKDDRRSYTDKQGRRRIGTKYIGYLHVALSLSLAATATITCWILASDSESRPPVSWPASSDYLASVLGAGAFFVAGLFPDADEPYSPGIWNATAWIMGLGFECALLALSFGGLLDAEPSESPTRTWTPIDTIQLMLAIVRILALSGMTIIYWLPRTLETGTPESIATPDETESLLPGNGEGSSSGYGATRDRLLKGPSSIRPGDAQTTDWTDYVAGFAKLFPFLWPSDSRALQIRAAFCFVLLICQRVVNILVPHQAGVLVGQLGPGKMPHWQLLSYVLLRGLQGQQGVIGSFRAILWIPISQSTYRRLTSAAFEHVLWLSLDFHLNKRIGEVMSALSKGSALNTFLDGFAFQLVPMVADLWISAIYFIIEFDFFYALVVISVTWIYLYVTIYMAKYRGRARREMTNRERDMEASKTDALMSYETVHHNSAVPSEMSRFDRLVSIFQRAEYKVFLSLNLLNALQNGVFTVGILILCYIDAFQISRHQVEVAKFVTLLTYLAQLQAPLSFFGSFYTQVQNNLVDAERMLDLFKEEPTIVDSEDAKPLDKCEGKITVEDVHFAYHTRKPALKGISFEVLPGTSTAVVGESGSGKSTLFKLLFHFYDVNSGSIKMDGVDLRKITVASHRSHFGIVPQDTILFNDTIMYNLLYSRPGATEEEVHAACKAASIHERIMAFPAGYETSVGDRGLKLSGGEKQRISIARTFLRSPQILLLDEATASLDSTTERQIQEALELVSKGRTTITIAHRLSTITKADQIIVLHEGSIVEKGTHAELLKLGGRYSKMWDQQTKKSKVTA